MIDIAQVNGWPEAKGREMLLKCCGAQRWAEQMLALKPFRDDAELLKAARTVWRGLSKEDWLEAFAAHPRIGDADALRKKFAKTAEWSAKEQAGVAGATEATLAGLLKGNRLYEERFGYIFIVCATGKSADEMLAILSERLNNAPEAEMQIAAGEQEKIMILRLQRITS